MLTARKEQKIKSELLKRYKFKDIIIVEAAGLSSVYANQGSIIVAFLAGIKGTLMQLDVWQSKIGL